MKIFIIVLSFCLMVIGGSGFAEMYRYKDAEGNIRFTDDFTMVPRDQRKTAKEYDTINDEFRRVPSTNSETQKTSNLPNRGTVQKSVEKSPDIEKSATDSSQDFDFNKLYDNLDEKRRDLEMLHESLEKSRKDLSESRKSAVLPEEIRSYNKRIKSFNEKVKEYNRQRKAFEAEVDEYNTNAVREMESMVKKFNSEKMPTKKGEK